MKLFRNHKINLIIISFVAIIMTGLISFSLLLFVVKPKASTNDNSPAQAKVVTKDIAADSKTSEIVKFNFVSNKLVDVKVVDKNDKLIASSINTVENGFDQSRYIYDVMSYDKGVHISNLRVPNGGVKVYVYVGNKDGTDVNLTTEASIADSNDDRTATARYVSTKTGKDGLLLSFDIVKPIAKTEIGKIAAGKTASNVEIFTEWSIPENIKMEKNEKKSIEIGNVDTSFDRKTIDWKSNDESIVSVSDTGVLTAKAYGSTMIYAIDGGKLVSCGVTVTLAATAIKNPDIQVKIKKFHRIETTYVPENATEMTIKYSNFDKNIVSVDEWGGLYGLSVGTTTITSTAENGLSTTFKVTVTAG